MPEPSADIALLEFYKRSERRITVLVRQIAMSDWRSAYTEARLEQIRQIIARLEARSKQWTSKQLSATYKDANRSVARSAGLAVPPFSMIDEGLVHILVTATDSDVGRALKSVVPQLERVFIDARQAIITAEQVKTQVAEGIVTGHPAMPEFELSIDTINDMLAYMKGLAGSGD